MASATIAVSYQDLCSKGLISDLKQAAKCDVKHLCSLSCNRCPNISDSIDLEKITILGLKLDHIEIKTTEEVDNFDLHLSGDNITEWLQKNDITYQIVPD